MSYVRNRGFMKDMNRADLLSMRAGGMGNVAIAKSLGYSPAMVYKLIGKQPEEITRRARQETAKRAREAKNEREEGYVVSRERKALIYTPKRDEAKAVLVLKPMQVAIPLHGSYMDYTISADRKTVDVDNSLGRTMPQIPADMLDTFIAELTAIRNNIGEDGMRQFWG